MTCCDRPISRAGPLRVCRQCGGLFCFSAVYVLGMVSVARKQGERLTELLDRRTWSVGGV